MVLNSQSNIKTPDTAECMSQLSCILKFLLTWSSTAHLFGAKKKQECLVPMLNMNEMKILL